MDLGHDTGILATITKNGGWTEERFFQQACQAWQWIQHNKPLQSWHLRYVLATYNPNHTHSEDN